MPADMFSPRVTFTTVSGWGTKKHGAGTLISASGEVYVGEWALNKKHGRGTLTAPGGDSHHGVWREGALEAGEEAGAHSC